MQNFFSLDEDFNKIIKNSLKEKFNSQEVKSMEQISTGWTNIVYKVKADNGTYYFRFPRDEFWERTIVKDYEFAKYIKGKTSFNTVDLKLGIDNNRPFSIHKEIPGKPLAEVMDSLTDEEVKKVSNQIAKFMYELHTADYKKDEVFDMDNIGLHLNDFITELLEKHVSDEDLKFWKVTDFKTKDNENLCLVHGDLNSSNILLDENNNVTAIIDFGFGGFGNKYFDISRIIGRCPENFKEPIMKAYKSFDTSGLNIDEVNKNIKTWSNIDQGYINYMRTIGIYS